MVVCPHTHIGRNEIDHGIEAPAERLAAGKPDIGYLRVAARQSDNQIVIEITDDGRGIDTDRLVEKAISAKIITKEKAAALTEEGRLNLIFAPGLSTARQLTSVSGRGVGLDVVQPNIEEIGGLLNPHTPP